MYKTFQTMAALLAILICSCQKEESPFTGHVENPPTPPVRGGNMVCFSLLIIGGLTYFHSYTTAKRLTRERRAEQDARR